MTKEIILEKIKKLLAVAEGSNYEEEAQSAMLKAQEFMLKHGITTADVEFKENKKEVLDESAAGSTRMPWYWKSLICIIGDNFRCKPYILKNRKSYACFIGLKDDVNLAKEIFNFAIETVEYCAKNYCEKYKKPGYNITPIKNDYITGFIRGLKDKFTEQVRNGNYALMLVKDNAVIEAIENKKLRKSQASKIRCSYNQNARDAGYQQGRNFQSSNKMIADY